MLKYKLNYIEKKPNPELSDLFSKILYFGKHNNNIIVEDLETNEAYSISDYKLGKFITLPEVKTPWIRTFGNELMRYKNKRVEQIVCLLREPTYLDLKFILPFAVKEHFSYTDKTFKCITKSIRNNPLKDILITAKLPMFQMLGWIKQLNESDEYLLYKLYFYIKGELYRFPYGNTDSKDCICLGVNTTNRFTTINQMFLSVVINRANNDYGFHLKEIEDNLRIDQFSEFFVKDQRILFDYFKSIYTLSKCTIEDVKQDPSKYYLKAINEEWLNHVRPNEIK